MFSENQKRLLAFLKTVRTNHGLDIFNFTKLLGVSKSAYYDFENGDRPLGLRALKPIADKLSLSGKTLSALVDPEAAPIDLPAPDSIKLDRKNGAETLTELMIDEEMANKIVALVKTAGKPIPISMLAEILRL